MFIVFDIETDGFLDVLTKVHVLSWSEDLGKTVKHTHDYEEMRQVIAKATAMVGHNIVRFDVKALEKVLNIKIANRLVDTLPMSWTINHQRQKHGLEYYGEDYGVPKPKIDDWDNLTPEEYAHRCNEDVKINCRLYKELWDKLIRIYRDENEANRYIDYLTFKMQCAADQETFGWRIDVPAAESLYEELMSLKKEKEEALAEAMPRSIVTKVVNKPKVMYKKDGTLSAAGERWHQYCRDNHMPTSVQSFKVKVGEERGNPNSVPQVKDWLFSLGWKPRTFNYKRDPETRHESRIPQVRDGADLCDSVIDLIDVDPAVSLLDGLTVLSHRSAMVKSFLDNQKDSWLKAEVAGLTNTLRFKHAKPLVNLPGVDKPWGSEIRGLLIAPDDNSLLCGSDMTSLEDTTKRHYMKPLDPDYVEEMSVEGYDPHLSLAVFSGDITLSEYEAYQHIDKLIESGIEPKTVELMEYKRIKKLRKAFKVVNYSATYGVQKVTLARQSGMSESDAQKLLDAFWGKNWAIREIASKLRVREAFGSMWVQNPVSGFWYSLRSDKDRFSTLNQGTGVYCFDMWVKEAVSRGAKVIGQFHDEIIAPVCEGGTVEMDAILKESIQAVNDKLKLNVSLSVDVQFGKSYADIH